MERIARMRRQHRRPASNNNSIFVYNRATVARDELPAAGERSVSIRVPQSQEANRAGNGNSAWRASGYQPARTNR